jgi:hypothetical protein
MLEPAQEAGTPCFMRPIENFLLQNLFY